MRLAEISVDSKAKCAHLNQIRLDEIRLAELRVHLELPATVDLGHGHAGGGQSARLIRADGGGAAHGFARRQVPHEILVLQHLAHREGEGNSDSQRQALGHGQIAWHREKTRVKVGGVTVFARGRSAGPAARRRAEAAHEDDELTIAVDLGLGEHASRLFTCDLTYDYVKINAEYRT